ncbi:MAG: hypothetical protein ACR2NP_23145 [Pirellulaceae bacterium]
MKDSSKLKDSRQAQGLPASPVVALHQSAAAGNGGFVELDGQRFYRIQDSHLMPEFFMSLISSSDHWMFVSSRGALTAGRRNADSALFPYYSADKLSDTRGSTGPLSVVRVDRGDGTPPVSWQPFAADSGFHSTCRQNLYKSELGNKLRFEEIHEELGLAFRYQWTFGDRFGFIRTTTVHNIGGATSDLNVLDGLQNLLPYGIEQNFQLRFSNLADAYKKSELIESVPMGIYYLSSIPTDRAEPSEGLRCTAVWQTGSKPRSILLSTRQLSRFGQTGEVETETDVRGSRGAWLTQIPVKLEAGQSTSWTSIATLNQDQTDVANLQDLFVNHDDPQQLVEEDIRACEQRLLRIVSRADGRQLGNEPLRNNRHQSNVMFNVMRGGLPAHGYDVNSEDFRHHVRQFNSAVFERNHSFLEELPATIHINDLIQQLSDQNEPDLLRIGLEYLPICFSRRHGDPTRPWNAFDIRLTKPDGSLNLDYQGNWRDIFQNWEALALSYPGFAISMVFRFVNASTADGYNPYRITKDGFEWEEADPQDPWSNIGYWGDHQIIYLLKLLEWAHRFEPQRLDEWLDAEYCTYAEVPYRIRSYDRICENPRETIDYDRELADKITSRVQTFGADGKLLQNRDGGIYRATLGEKLLVPALAKLTNFVPEGGIWLNTQRPEWNDANNALAGYGLSMVTVCHLRRYFRFLQRWLSRTAIPTFLVSTDIVSLLEEVTFILASHRPVTGENMTNHDRKVVVDTLSRAGCRFRTTLYERGLSGEKQFVQVSGLLKMLELCLEHFDHTIAMNRRSDGLYHAYNLIEYTNGHEQGFRVEHLGEMLEGQVAVLSSGFLSPGEAADLLDALRASDMYREDQQSYTLYPDRQLTRFTDKNRIDPALVTKSQVLEKFLDLGDESVVRRDVHGTWHFNGNLRNADELRQAIQRLSNVQGDLPWMDEAAAELTELFEATFNHRHFTGRSGTFFGYEGLGCIYWHMVSKLVLAVQETLVDAQANDADLETLNRLHTHYRSIRDGVGLNKSPLVYGAFPTDPYSHTPAEGGVKQPGMTGQVKEDILSRLCEIGVRVQNGTVSFDPAIFETAEFLTHDSSLSFYDVEGNFTELAVPAGAFAFTFCQTPVIYRSAAELMTRIHLADGTVQERSGSTLSEGESQDLFCRNGSIARIELEFPTSGIDNYW